jgi:cell division protein ZapA
MANRSVELTVAGTSCRVVTTADAEELQLLVDMVESKLAAVLKAGRPVTTQAMLLAAVALANEVHEERTRADAIANRAKQTLGQLLERVDSALDGSEELARQRQGRRRKGDGKPSERGAGKK